MQYDSNHPPNTTLTFEPATLSASRRIQKSAIPVYRSFNSLAAFSLMISARTSSLLKHKVLFGSDNPVIQPDRWLAEFEKLPIKDEVRALIIKENAAKLLKLR